MHVAEGHIELAIVQPRGGNDRQVVIERVGDIVKSDARVGYRWCVIGSSRLDDENARAGRGQFRGQNRTGRARSHK